LANCRLARCRWQGETELEGPRALAGARARRRRPFRPSAAEAEWRGMSWLTNFVRPKIRALVKKPDTPDNLWDKCPACGQMIFHPEPEANQRVCTHCGHHLRLGVKRRLELMFDDGQFERVDLPKVEPDPLKFRDRKRYTDRVKESQSKTGEQDAIIVA